MLHITDTPPLMIHNRLARSNISACITVSVEAVSMQIFQKFEAKMDANASSQLLTNEENRKINDLIQ